MENHVKVELFLIAEKLWDFQAVTLCLLWHMLSKPLDLSIFNNKEIIPPSSSKNLTKAGLLLPLEI